LVQHLHFMLVVSNLFSDPVKSMEIIQLTDFDQNLPEQMPVSVIMERRPSSHAWVDYTYKAIGVIPGETQPAGSVRKMIEENGVQQYLYSGFEIKLYVDECEGYYHNLMSPHPGCYVVASNTDDPDAIPTPYLVSLSFDHVHAYLEGDELVYAVDIPAELYKWTEAFILTHYIATKKFKRKLNNWKKPSQDDTAPNLRRS